jgi:hypothetical protein
MLRPKGSTPASYRHWGFPPIPSMRFVAHSAELPTEVKEVLAMFEPLTGLDRRRAKNSAGLS